MGESSGPAGGLPLPTYVQFTGVKPDIAPPKDGRPVFYHYPSDPPSIISAPPLSTGPASAFTTLFGQPAPPLNKNKFWQELNKALGAKLDMMSTPNADYNKKLATLIAGGDYPDMVQFYGPQPNLPQILESKFADVTDLVGGDAIKAYPSLANLPSDAWLGAVYNEKIYGVPRPNAAVGSIILRRDDILTKLGRSGDPGSYADFTKLCGQVTDESANRWALAVPAHAYDIALKMMGIPRLWAVKDGEFTATEETDQAKQAISEALALIKSGVFHPDWPSGSQKAWFDSGKVVFMEDNYSSWPFYITRGRVIDKAYELGGMIPPAYDSSSQGITWRGPAYFSFVAFKKAAVSRLKELIGVLNYIAAPPGTKEYLFVRYGVEGVDYKLQGADPIETATGTAEVNPLAIVMLIIAPEAIYSPGDDALAKKQHDYEAKALPLAVGDPTLGLYSPTQATKGAMLAKIFTNAMQDIWQGRKSLSSWDDAVKSWRSQGGGQMKKEYAEAYAASH
jgi:putative aldouronate transport system substrate-binding protein